MAPRRRVPGPVLMLVLMLVLMPGRRRERMVRAAAQQPPPAPLDAMALAQRNKPAPPRCNKRHCRLPKASR